MDSNLSLQITPFQVLLKFIYNNKYFSKIFLIIFLSAPFLFAQELSSILELRSRILQFPDSLNSTETSSISISAQPDTTIQVFKPKLLPDNMSLMEKGLWGEHSILRGIGIAPELTRESRMNELKIRRTMLSIHQIGGFASLGLMLATCYYGQRIVDGDFSVIQTKRALVTATIATYSLTALLSILSPPPLIRRDEFSTTSLHKTLAWFHVAGMIITPILGKLIDTRRAFHMDKAHYHQIAGYITTAIFASAMIVITF
ncbi:MAG: hypothetical protein NTX65_14470 [Ignavibacteriales bacterium]|nr:hypothetical protein [Ignavibacteriales bacterium]